MRATIDERGEIIIPARVRKDAGINPGDVVNVQVEGDGRIALVRMDRIEQSKPLRPKITYRKGTHAVATTGRPITSAQVRMLEAFAFLADPAEDIYTLEDGEPVRGPDESKAAEIAAL